MQYILFFICLVKIATGFAPIAVVPQRQQQQQQLHRSLTTTTSLQVAVDTSEIKNGLTVELDGEPHRVLGFSIMKQARGAAKTTIKFKNLIRGTTIENTYRSGEKFETATIEKTKVQFTYNEGVSSISIYCSTRRKTKQL